MDSERISDKESGGETVGHDWSLELFSEMQTYSSIICR